MKKTVVTAAALACVIAAGTSSADIVTETLNFNSVGQFYVNQFDPSLGTLTSVTLDWVVNTSILNASITNNGPGQVTVESVSYSNIFRAFAPSVGSTQLALRRLNGSSVNSPEFEETTLNQGGSISFSNLAFSQYNATNTITSGLEAFSGSGTFGVWLTNSVAPSIFYTSDEENASVTNTVSTSASGSLVVTYNYDAAPVAAIPEPSEIMLGGIPLLFGVAFLLRRVRRAPSAV